MYIAVFINMLLEKIKLLHLLTRIDINTTVGATAKGMLLFAAECDSGIGAIEIRLLLVEFSKAESISVLITADTTTFDS